MPLISPKKGKPERDQSLLRYEVDGYEQGGLLYFRVEGKEMVAVVRERKDFDKHRERGTSLQDYLNTEVGYSAYGATLELEKLVPLKPLPNSPEDR